MPAVVEIAQGAAQGSVWKISRARFYKMADDDDDDSSADGYFGFKLEFEFESRSRRLLAGFELGLFELGARNKRERRCIKIEIGRAHV